MITIEQVAARMDVAPETIADAFAAVDQAPLVTAAEARFIGFVWDQTGPLLDQSADHWLSRSDIIPGGAVYVFQDANAQGMAFQPHDPEKPGLVAMSAERAQELVDAMRQVSIEAAVTDAVIQAIQAAQN